MVARPRVFLSADRELFEPTRQMLFDKLAGCGCDVVVESAFPRPDLDALTRIERSVCTSDVVVHLTMGQAPAGADNQAVRSFLQSLGDSSSLSAGKRKSRESLERCPEISLSQWEALIAVHCKVRLLAYTPAVHAVPDPIPKVQPRGSAEMINGGFQTKVYVDEQDLIFRLIEDLKSFFPGTRAVQNGEIVFHKRPCNLPQSTLGSRFQGRDQFLRTLGSQFSAGQSESTARQGKRIAIQGDGGVGKTRAAAEYAVRHMQDYSAVLHLSASSRQRFDSCLANLVDVLLIEGMQESTDDIRQQAVIDWLQSNPNWLMIVDDADTEDAATVIQDRLQRLTCGHLLITSILSEWTGPVSEVSLGPLDLASATRYLLESAHQRNKASDDDRHAQQIAQQVRRLPLGLELAAAYVNCLGIRFEQYVMQWEIHENAILGEFDLSQINFPQEMLVAWKLSVDQLDEQALQLLEMLAWFSSAPIPSSMFEAVPGVCLVGDANHALATLQSYALVNCQASGDQGSYWLHELILRSTRDHLRRRQTSGVNPLPSLDDALRWIDAVFQGDVQDAGIWPKLESYLDHVLSVCEFAFQASKTTINHATARLTSDVAALYFVKGRLQEADPLMRRVLEIDEHAYGPDHPHVAIRLNNLAVLLNETGRLLEAEPLMRRTLAIVEKAYGVRHPKVAIRLNNLAQLLKATGRLPEAEPLMRRALSIDQQQYGPVHPKVAVRLNNLTQLLQATNRQLDAEPLMRRAVLIDEQEYGPEDSRVAVRLHNLARLLQDAEYLSEAEPAMRRALMIFARTLTPKHPKTMTVIDNYRLLLQDLGQPAGQISQQITNALNTQEELLPITPELERMLGPAKPIDEVLAALDQRYRDEGRPSIWFLPQSEPLAPHLVELLGPLATD